MGLREKLGKLFPKGFHPRDEEIIEDLQHKVLGQTDECVIPHVDVHEHGEAWELATMINEMWEWKLKEWCFIRSFKGKYKKGNRQCRKTRSGYWKVTGKDRKIRNEDTNKVIGTKKTLVFYTGRVPKGKRTNWVMHEYHLTPKYLAKHNIQDQMAYVGCHLRKKKDKKGAVCGASQSDQADDHSISISNASDLTMEGKVAENDPMSMLNNPDNVVAEGSVIVVEDGSHSSCNIAPETEIADIPGNKVMQINNYPTLEEEPFRLDFNYLDNFFPSEFLCDPEMENGGGSIGGGGGGGGGGDDDDDDDEWITSLILEEPNDPEGGKGISQQGRTE